MKFKLRACFDPDEPSVSTGIFQRIAINRTVEAIARGQNRILLVMATGTGKTYTAFQIIYRLWKSGCKKRILYLADRNNLITQTKKGDFKHFKDKCHIISAHLTSLIINLRSGDLCHSILYILLEFE